MKKATKNDFTVLDTHPLVVHFYSKVKVDALLSPYFASVHWESHLPKLAAFWEKIVFGSGSYEGFPMPVHVHVHQYQPITPQAMERWQVLFFSSVDDLFEGPAAEKLKLYATRIGSAMMGVISKNSEGNSLSFFSKKKPLE
jgi:hemoglobin